jgi:hypothetical protein
MEFVKELTGLRIPEHKPVGLDINCWNCSNRDGLLRPALHSLRLVYFGRHGRREGKRQ